MQTSHSLRGNPQIAFRRAVLNGDRPAPLVVAALESQGINVSDLEYRILYNREFTR